MKKIKVCIISSYPPTKDGVGFYTKELVSKLINKADIQVLTFKDKYAKREVNIHRVISGNIFNIVNLYKSLKEFKPNIIHVQYATPIYKFYSPFLWLQLIYFREVYEVRIFITLHEVAREIHRLGIFGVAYYKFISNFSDKIFVHTREAALILEEKCKVNKSKINIIPLGIVEVKQRKEKNQELPAIKKLKNENIILYFGYIHIDKGLHHFINAASDLYRLKPDMKKNTIFIIAGDVRPRSGAFRIFELIDKLYLKKLIRLRNRLKLEEYIKFIGYVEDKHITSLFNASKAIVLPYSEVEQSGVLNLALAMKIPIIASNIGGLKETLGDIGILVPRGNSKKIALSILKVISDKKYSLKLINGYKKIQNIKSMNNASKIYIKNYHEVN